MSHRFHSVYVPRLMCNTRWRHFARSTRRFNLLSGAISLSELAIDGNPISHELSYKQTVLCHVSQIRQLDMKRVTDEERRIATVMGRKEDEKKRESSRMQWRIPEFFRGNN